MDGMAPTHYLGHGCPCLFNRHAGTGNPVGPPKKGEGFLPELDCIQTQPGTAMPLTVPEVRRLLEKVLWQQVVPLIHIFLSLQKAIAFSVSTTVVLVLQLQIVDLLHILSTERERFGRNSIDPARFP